MPRIVCHACGREVYTSAPVDQLFAEEKRCPRCGALLEDDRRQADRRTVNRRENPPGDPGPPGDAERRIDERRKGGRRRSDGGPGRRSSAGRAE